MNPDSIDGIRAHLSRGLTGLHELQAARRARYKELQHGAHSTPLQNFIVLGSIYFDEAGGMYRLRFTNWKHGTDVSWLPQALPDVLPARQFGDVLPGATYEYSCDHFLPTAEQTCSHCGQAWDLTTFADAHKAGMKSDDDRCPIYQHLRCMQLDGEHKAHEWGVASATEAGFTKPVVRVVPNGYWPDAYVVERAREPWCVLATHWGDLTFGWRKRVVSLSWSDVVKRLGDGFSGDRRVDVHERRVDVYERRRAVEAALAATTLFPNEDVTRDGPLIHAWNQSKFVEYLRVLRRAFSETQK